MTPVTAASTTRSPWRGGYGRITIGVFALAFLFAFEALAVATVMPAVAAELDGLRWYPIAFAAPFAAAVVALAASGAQVDRIGPAPALRIGLLVFCTGVIVAGLAPTMPVFVLGRLIHGYGGGMLGVALYVVIAQAYPAAMRPRVFAVLTTAWVLPALVGPLLAAQVAELVGWRWVFLAVPFVAVAAWLLVLGTPSHPSDARGEPGKLRWALLTAAGLLAVSLGGQQVLSWWPVLVAAGLAATVLGGLRVLPHGAWSLRAGLPVVLLSRAAVGAAFAAAEVYVPLLLVMRRELSIGGAGWVLTTGAVTWSLGATLAARWRVLADQPGRVRLGAMLAAIGVAGFATVSIDAVPLGVVIATWGVAGLGIGMAYSTLSVLALATAPPDAAGRTSSALQLNDNIVTSAAVAIGGVVFAALAATAPAGAATGLVLAAGAVAALGLIPAARLRS